MVKFKVIFWKLSIVLFTVLFSFSCFAQDNVQTGKYPKISMEPFGDSSRHWYGIRDENNIINPSKNQPRYDESEITKIADNILLFQRNNGGWAKNYDMQAILKPDQVDSVFKTKNIFHTTFDNSTTYTHIEYLAKVYKIIQIEKYKTACLNGIRFCLSAQYPNGGWPQYYPIEKGNYSRRITFNDGAYVGVMRMLGKILNKNADFSFVGNDIRKKVAIAYEKGLNCILDMQIFEKGRLTAWCQQHDEKSLKPAWARAYEPPSICNGESSSIVLFLMGIDKPDARIIKSVQSAVKWFYDSRIYNTRFVTIKAPLQTSKYRDFTTDRVAVIDSTAPPIWTRYYELETERPLFSDRNGKFLYSLSEVSRERRNGYGWYTYSPQEALDIYPEWQKKWASD